MRKIKVYDVFFITIILYSLATFFYRVILSFLQITKVIGLLNIISLMYIYAGSLKKRDIFTFLFVIFIDIIEIVNNHDFNKTFEHISGITSTILIINKLGEENFRKKIYDVFKKYEKKMLVFLKIMSIAVVLCLLTTSCYQISLGNKIFVGYTDGAHAACSSLCLFFSFSN